MGRFSPGRWRGVTWFLLVFNIGMFLWVVFGTGGFCDEYVGADLEACLDGEYGYDAGRAFVVILWFWGTMLAGLWWIIGAMRRKSARRRAAEGGD